MEHFDNLKLKLTERKAKLEDLLNRVENSARRQLDKSYEEQAIQRENEEVLTSLDNSLNQEFEDIEKALFRFEAGTYGICESCNSQISATRLEALPHTSKCINCAI